jgi:transposase
MTKTQVEVITSVQRRRRWSRAEKERIVAAALEPGAVASEVAREAGIHTSQLFRWRQRQQAPPPEDTRGSRISRLELVTTPHSADSTILQCNYPAFADDEEADERGADHVLARRVRAG